VLAYLRYANTILVVVSSLRSYPLSGVKTMFAQKKARARAGYRFGHSEMLQKRGVQ